MEPVRAGTPIAAAGATIANDAVVAAQRWAEFVICARGIGVVGWVDGYDPHGERAYVLVLREPLAVPEAEPPALVPGTRAQLAGSDRLAAQLKLAVRARNSGDPGACR